MSNTKLDDAFKDELTAIENWFRVLSDPERTACLYSLLKGTTPLQIRFFITVLQQMAAKDAHMDPLAHSMLMSTGVRPTSVVSNPTDDLGRLFARPNSQRLSSEYSVRTHSLLRSSSSQDDFTDEAIAATPRHSASQKSHSPVKDDLLGSADWQSKMTARTSSLHMPEMPKPIAKPTSISTLPPRAPLEKHSPTSPTVPVGSHPYSHITSIPPRNVQTATAAEVPAITPRQIGRSLPRPRQAADEESEWDASGATLARSKVAAAAAPPSEAIDLNEIQGNWCETAYPA
ncbi:hypothetical protein HDU91_003861 [Kappamyces sp. JEL0680]|nr:hypothetical protein HDU91_003861 [Kappamyces sp. JEL0680]